MRAMLFVLFLVGCTGGTETVKNWKGTSLKAEGFDCGVPMNLQSYSILERCFVPALKPVEKIVLPSKPDFAKKVKFLQICNFFSSDSKRRAQELFIDVSFVIFGH